MKKVVGKNKYFYNVNELWKASMTAKGYKCYENNNYQGKIIYLQDNTYNKERLKFFAIDEKYINSEIIALDPITDFEIKKKNYEEIFPTIYSYFNITNPSGEKFVIVPLGNGDEMKESDL